LARTMTALILIRVALLATILPASAQLVLQEGETWVYSFDSLPLTGRTNAFLTSPQGMFAFAVDGSTLQSGSRLAYDLFETSPAETPFLSGTLQGGDQPFVFASSPGAWQDEQGAIRFRMVSGSATVDLVALEAIVAGASLSSYDVYSTNFVPTPEPGTWSLLAAGLGVGGLWVARRRRPRAG
jgi:hypothetical protein